MGEEEEDGAYISLASTPTTKTNSMSTSRGNRRIKTLRTKRRKCSKIRKSLAERLPRCMMFSRTFGVTTSRCTGQTHLDTPKAKIRKVDLISRMLRKRGYLYGMHCIVGVIRRNRNRKAKAEEGRQ